MPKKYILPGQIFNDLTIVRELPERRYSYRAVVWECKCVCGSPDVVEDTNE